MLQISENQIITWLQRLVAIPSVTPEQAGPRAGVPGEGAIATALAEWFTALGGEVYSEDVLPGRPNVYGIWRGRSQRWAALDIHTDTVGVEQMPGDPFNAAVRNGRVHGRGAVDTKASLAVILALLETLQQSGQQLEANLVVGATADEEVLALGAPVYANWLKKQGILVDEMIVAEPTMCGPVYGHTGVVRLAFEVQGIAAHSSMPDQGKNAITAAAHLVLAIDAEHQRLSREAPLTALGKPTLTATIIQGGRGQNIVPDACTVTIDRRVVAGESLEAIIADLHELAHRASPLPVNIKQLLALGSFLYRPDSAWVEMLASWSGQSATIAPYGTNAWAYNDVARECIVLGPGSIEQAHGIDEWVEISQLQRLAEIYTRWLVEEQH